MHQPGSLIVTILRDHLTTNVYLFSNVFKFLIQKIYLKFFFWYYFFPEFCTFWDDFVTGMTGMILWPSNMRPFCLLSVWQKKNYGSNINGCFCRLLLNWLFVGYNEKTKHNKTTNVVCVNKQWMLEPLDIITWTLSPRKIIISSW